MPHTADVLPSEGRALLRLIVDEIGSGRIDPTDPKTFIPYSEALSKLGHPSPNLYSGRRLQQHGLTALNEWTLASKGVPHICGLIVAKKNWRPGNGFPHSHGLDPDSSWEAWWLRQARASVEFDWSAYL